MKDDWEVCSPFRHRQMIISDKKMAWEEARFTIVTRTSQNCNNCRYSCEKLGRSHLWYPNSSEEANAFNTYFWARSWPRQSCYNFWSPVKLLEGEDQYVNIYSQARPPYVHWYPGEPNRDQSSPCLKAVLTSGDLQLADSKGGRQSRTENSCQMGEIISQ